MLLLPPFVFINVFTAIHVKSAFYAHFSFDVSLPLPTISTIFPIGLINADYFHVFSCGVFQFRSVRFLVLLGPLVLSSPICAHFDFRFVTCLFLLFFVHIFFVDIDWLGITRFVYSFFCHLFDYPFLFSRPFFDTLLRYGSCRCNFITIFVFRHGFLFRHLENIGGAFFRRLPQPLHKLRIPFEILEHKLKFHINVLPLEPVLLLVYYFLDDFIRTRHLNLDPFYHLHLFLMAFAVHFLLLHSLHPDP